MSMILVVGPRASGKKTFVYGLGYSRGECSRTLVGRAPVLLDLQMTVSRWVDEDAYDPDAELPASLLSKEVVTCTEVGSGVVPVSERDRVWRDAVGRTCNKLADRASCVVRMVCGIPVAIKGELPGAREGR